MPLPTNYVKLTKRDRKMVIFGLMLAIDYQYGLIDAHRIGVSIEDGQTVRTVPEEYQSQVKTWENDIRRFRELIGKLNGMD